MRIVLDTCVLKLATLPGETNYSALVVDLVLRGQIQAVASPAMIEEYMQVLSDAEDFLSALLDVAETCYPLNQLKAIRHEPDNRFLECAFAAGADAIVTVNIARGHFDRDDYDGVLVCTPGRFVRLSAVQSILRSPT